MRDELNALFADGHDRPYDIVARIVQMKKDYERLLAAEAEGHATVTE